MKNFVIIWALFLSGLSYGSEKEIYKFKLPSGVDVEIIERTFIGSEFHIVDCNGSGNCLINGKPTFGNGEYTPKTYVQSFAVLHEGREFELETDSIFNAWMGRPLGQVSK